MVPQESEDEENGREGDQVSRGQAGAAVSGPDAVMGHVAPQQGRQGHMGGFEGFGIFQVRPRRLGVGPDQRPIAQQAPGHAQRMGPGRDQGQMVPVLELTPPFRFGPEQDFHGERRRRDGGTVPAVFPALVVDYQASVPPQFRQKGQDIFFVAAAPEGQRQGQDARLPVGVVVFDAEDGPAVVQILPVRDLLPAETAVDEKDDVVDFPGIPVQGLSLPGEQHGFRIAGRKGPGACLPGRAQQAQGAEKQQGKADIPCRRVREKAAPFHAFFLHLSLFRPGRFLFVSFSPMILRKVPFRQRNPRFFPKD